MQSENEKELHEFILQVANRLADAAEVLAHLAEKQTKVEVDNKRKEPT